MVKIFLMIYGTQWTHLVNRLISKVIAHDILRFLLLLSGTQIVTISLIMVFFSFQDASERSKFLADSNRNSLGLMLSIGDVFQLKNTVKSFTNELTTGAWLLNKDEKNVFILVDTDNPPKIVGHENIIHRGMDIFVFTKEPIKYNNHLVGYLVLKNKVNMKSWALICSILLFFSCLLVVIHSKILEKKSMRIAGYVRNINFFIDSVRDKEHAIKLYNSRQSTGVVEFEYLAAVIKDSFIKILESATMEKEAAVGRIIANLSHDLRAHLGTFEKLLQTPDESMPSMRGAVKDSLNILNSMIESLRHSEVENLIKKSRSNINFQFGKGNLQGKADAHKIDFHILLDDPGEVWIDPLKVERAWINLATNALEAAKSFVRVEVDKIDTTLFIRVVDDGPGVPEDFLPKLFQRGATHGKHDGTGLGLAYVRQIMRGHGGDVVYRRENGLTIFECHLPNAVNIEKENAMELEVNTGMSLEQVKPKIVSICLDPSSVAEEVLAVLASRISSKFTFNEKYSYGVTDLVVTNNPEMAARILEEDGQVEIAEYQPGLPQDLLKARILRRFES